MDYSIGILSFIPNSRNRYISTYFGMALSQWLQGYHCIKAARKHQLVSKSELPAALWGMCNLDLIRSPLLVS